MALTIVWSETALSDFASQLAYIAKTSPAGAQLVRQRLDQVIVNLSDMPTGRAGRVPNTYEKYIPKTSLIIAFDRPDQQTLAILRIIHAKRDWPQGSWPPEASN